MKREKHIKIFRTCGSDRDQSFHEVVTMAEEWRENNEDRVDIIAEHEHTTHDVKDDEFYYEHYIKFTYYEKEK